MFKILILKTIRFYQKNKRLIFIPQGVCRFQPTCSEYAYQAIYSYGIIYGVYLAVKRILKCNPFTKSSYDPIPIRKI